MPALITSKHIELFDASKLQIIIDNWSDIPIREDARMSWKVGNKTYDPIKILKDIMVRSKFEKDVGQLAVSYVHSKKADCHGRQFAQKGRSLQSVSREIRHTIAKEFYNDIDMCNAHPSILLQYSKKKGWACERIQYYTDNRDACLEELMGKYNIERDNAKKILLAITNGGELDYDALDNKPSWLIAFKKQCDMIHDNMMKDPSRKAVVSAVKKYKTHNIPGSVSNHVLCDVENMILNTCVKFLESQRIPTKNLVLMFDGFMLPKDSANVNAVWLASLGKYVHDATGYLMTFTQKELNNDIDLTGFYKDEVDERPPRVALDDNEASDLFLDDVRDILHKCNGVVYICTERHVWVTNESMVRDILLEKCLRANIIDETRKPYSARVNRALNIIKATLAKLPDEPDFTQQVWKSTIGKICFQDGVYDFDSAEFKPWAEVNDVFTTIVINRPFPKRNNVIIDELKRRVFNAAFDNDSKSSDFMKSIARGLAGQVKDKQFLVGLGERNSSKGIIVDMCQAAFGNYTNVVKTEYFLMDRGGNSDYAKKEGWLMDCEFTRLTFANEISINALDKKHTLDGNMIKRFTSGGDTQNSRRLHENARNFYIQSKLFIMCNDLPPVTPADATESLVMFKFPFKFVTKDDMENPLPFFRERDESLKDWVKLPEVADALVHLVIDAYETSAMVMGADVQRDTLEYRMDAGDELLLFRNFFTITKRKSDYVTCKAVDTFIQSKALNMSMAKVKDRLVKMGAFHTRARVNGVTTRVYSCMILNNNKDGAESDEDV